MRIIQAAGYALLMTSWTYVSSLPASGQSPDRSGRKVEQLLKDAGYTYKTLSATVWTVEVPGTNHVHGKESQNVHVIITFNPDTVITFAKIADDAKARNTPEMMQKLLHDNTNYDTVKIGLDSNGELQVRIDTKMRLVDAQELKYVISQVASVSDDVFAEIANSSSQ